MKYSRKIIPLVTTLLAFTLLALGAWWVYMINNLSFRVNFLQKFAPGTYHQINVDRMIIWEGGTFIFLTIFLSITLLILFLRDIKKNHAMQAFFASVTHELKTPLASIRLQTEVINDMIQSDSEPQKPLQKMSGRIIDDVGNLENQMDKILQLSRIERGGNLNVTPIDLKAYLERVIIKECNHFEIITDFQGDCFEVQVDEFALKLIIKNLLENSRKHTQSKTIKFSVTKSKRFVNLVYRDEGTFTGDITRIGKIFYKHNSPKGSGIGIYIIKMLMEKMNGGFEVTHQDSLVFDLKFKKAKELLNA